MPIRTCRWRPLGERPAGSGGGGIPIGFALVRPLPGRSSRQAPAHPVPCAYLGVSLPGRARDHRPRRGHLCGALPLPAVSPADPSCQAYPTPSLGTWSVATNTLGPAQCPRKRGSAAKPRPASPLFTGIVGRRPAGPPNYHRPRALKATVDTLLSALPPAGTCPDQGCAGLVVSGAARSLTQGKFLNLSEPAGSSSAKWASGEPGPHRVKRAIREAHTWHPVSSR